MIQKERLINTFVELVKIDSPTGEEQDVAVEVASRLLNFGLKPHIDRHSNVIASVPGDSRLSPIILNSHLDTVEPGRGIRPIIHKDKITSSGDTILGVDDKAGVASILETVECLYEKGFAQNRPLDLVFTVHEESITDGPRLLDYSLIKARKGFAFDLAQPLGNVVMEAPFYNNFSVSLLGKSGHAARPHLADNALSLGSEAINKLKLGWIGEDSVRNIISTTSFKSKNVIPGEMEYIGEVRSYLEELVEKYTDEVDKAFTEVITQYRETSGRDITYNFTKQRENGGFKYDKKDPLIEYAAKAVRQIGIRPHFLKKSMACYDANTFAEKRSADS